MASDMRKFPHIAARRQALWHQGFSVSSHVHLRTLSVLQPNEDLIWNLQVGQPGLQADICEAPGLTADWSWASDRMVRKGAGFAPRNFMCSNDWELGWV